MLNLIKDGYYINLDVYQMPLFHYNLNLMTLLQCLHCFYRLLTGTMCFAAQYLAQWLSFMHFCMIYLRKRKPHLTCWIKCFCWRQYHPQNAVSLFTFKWIELNSFVLTHYLLWNRCTITETITGEYSQLNIMAIGWMV